MKYRIYFQYKNGMDDQLIVSGDSIEEIREEVDRELKARDAEYIGSECLEE